MDKNILSINGLSKSYGDHKVLDDVSFDIKQGEAVGLLGGSGSGKTTLARIILGLLPFDKGEIYYNNVKIGNYERLQFSREVQIVFQDPQTSLNPRMKIAEALSEPLKVHNIYKKERIIELLDMVNLPQSHLKRFPHELSGGERQRVGIARALSLNPKFIILDEPVSSLDLSIQVQVLNLLKELKSKLNLTYLFIAHDIAVVNYLCGRSIRIDNGKILI